MELSAQASGSTPSSAAGAATEKFISFELRGQRCCVPASAVAEVVHVLQTAALPDPPEWLIGLAAYRGEPVAVIDPSVLAAGPARSVPGRRAKTIIFRKQPDASALQYALPIDSLQEMILAETGKFPPAGNLPVQDLDLGGGRVRLIDPALLFQHLAASRT